MTNEHAELLREYKSWILDQNFSEGTIEEEDNNIKITTSYSIGQINFYDLEIVVVEMSVINLADDENKFYLHFELRDFSYAKELFAEMLSTIIELKDKQSLKILLSCTGGLTTGFFAEKLNEAAKLLNVDYKFDAVTFPKLYEKAFDYSIILLAPQIAYQSKKVQEILHDQLVLKIPPKIFASYDSGEMLKFIRQQLDHREKTIAERVIAKVRKGVANNAKILSIAILPTHSRKPCRRNKCGFSFLT